MPLHHGRERRFHDMLRLSQLVLWRNDGELGAVTCDAIQKRAKQMADGESVVIP
jgi:hypothetical protein